jgi:uncharacterized membrane protein
MSVPTRTDRARRATAPDPPRPPLVRPLSSPGVALAVAFFCLSQTPSLLPRPWFLQGTVSGIAAATGYAFGALLPRRVSVPWRVLAIAAPVPIALSLELGTRWQGDLRRRLGMAPLDTYYVTRMVAISLAVFLLLLMIARTVRWITRRLVLLLCRVAPRPVARCAGVLVIALVAVSAVDSLVVGNIFAVADRRAAVRNHGTDVDVVAPTSGLRSGGPYSLVPWNTLGRQGRDFVGRGPSRAQLSAFAGRPAIEPIRVYAGLDSADSIAARTRLVLREMDRTGAFDRAVIAVVVPTGTGWVDSAVTNSLEYMYAGDTAMVSMQYSYLPSWASLLADRSVIIHTASALITAVRDRWAALPPAARPRLLLFGESLGTLGTEETFGTVERMATGADGMLLEGPTFANPLHRQITEGRVPGTPVWDPGFREQPVEFAAKPAELRRPGWPRPTVVYLQNSSDPVVWWSPDLLFRSPEWLRQPRGPDLSPDMHWYPGITFWQTTVDLIFANKVPRGHGHVYTSGVVDGWAALAPPPGWTVADTLRLRALLGG